MNHCQHLGRSLSEGFVCLSANCTEDRIVCCQHCFLSHHPHETIEFTKFNEVSDKLKPLVEIDRKKLEFRRLARDVEVGCRAVLNNFIRENISKITEGVDVLVPGNPENQPDRMLKRLIKQERCRECIIHGSNYSQLTQETQATTAIIDKVCQNLRKLQQDVNFLVGCLNQRLQLSEVPLHQQQRVLPLMLQMLDTTNDTTSTTDFQTFTTGSIDL